MPGQPAAGARPRREGLQSPAPEFGFKRLRLCEAGSADPVLGTIGDDLGGFLAIQWHDDAWDLPVGARLLASSEAWPNQAFRYGADTLAIQFHLEFTAAAYGLGRSTPGRERIRGSRRRKTSPAFASPSHRYDEIRTSMEKVLAGMLGKLRSLTGLRVANPSIFERGKVGEGLLI